MPFNINTFLGELNKGGVAKAAHYEVIITPPPVLQGTETRDLRSLSMRAEEASFPGRGISVSNFKIYGPDQKIAMDSTFNDLSVTFLASEGLEEYDFFTRWQDNIVGNYRVNQSGDGMSSRFDLKFLDDYSTDIDILTYNDRGDLMNGVKVVKAFPMNIDDTSLNWNSQELIKFRITFTYHYIKEINI